MPLRPKILLLALEANWPGAARLPQALQEAGFTVGVACRAKAYLAHTRFRDHFFLLPEKNHGLGQLAGLRTIVKAWPPDLILPMDDWTAFFLARIHEHLANDRQPDELVRLLRRSLGNPAAVFEAASKRRTVETAQSLGVRVPASRTVEAVEDILEFGRTHGFPVVLKQSFGSGGNGVSICHDGAKAAAVMARWQRKLKLKDQVSLWQEEFRGRQMERFWLPADQSLTASGFIAGKCATLLAATVGGRMLAALTAVKLEAFPDENGPSSVLRFVRNEEMRRTAETMLRHWGLTGLIGFDFILDAAGRAWLLECNPRPTPISHLGKRAGEDLCAALHAGLTGAALPPAAPENGWEVAHFPSELWRDPRSPHLASAFHDVPVNDPDLLNALKQAIPPQRPVL